VVDRPFRPRLRELRLVKPLPPVADFSGLLIVEEDVLEHFNKTITLMIIERIHAEVRHAQPVIDKLLVEHSTSKYWSYSTGDLGVRRPASST